MYLLDTNVVSELRKAQTGKAEPHVVKWAASIQPETLYLSVVSILELETGILLMERWDMQQGALLRRWLEDQVLPAFDGRILPIDVTVVRRCAELHVPDRRSERDAMIAATALIHRMKVVTRNVSNFDQSTAEIVNPWVAGE